MNVLKPLKGLKLLLLTVIVCIAAGCKVEVIAVEGGSVVSLSGTRDCVEGTNCVFEITDPGYSETFTAVPRAGYEFVNWQDGAKFECGGRTASSCTSFMPGGAVSVTLIGLHETRYLMPVFHEVDIDTDLDGDTNRTDDDDDNDLVLDVDDACPLVASPTTLSGCPAITDIVVVDGNEWAQTDLFRNLKWNSIEQACPAGVCSGALNGYDVEGWIWASIEDLNGLFNHYIELPALGPGPDTYDDLNTSTWAPAFFADGWRPTYSDGLLRRTYGFVSYADTSHLDRCYSPSIVDGTFAAPSFIDIAHTDSTKLRCSGGGSEGAWLYRSL